MHGKRLTRGLCIFAFLIGLFTGSLFAALSDGGAQAPQFQNTRVVFTSLRSWLAQVRPLASEPILSRTLPSESGDYYVAISQIAPHRYALFVYSTATHAMEHFGWGFRDDKGKPLTITNNGLITRQYQVPIPSGTTSMTVPYGTDILFDPHCSGTVTCQIALPSDHQVDLVDLKFTLK